MAEKAKAEGNNFVKKLLSSNLTWSIVAFILLVIICTIFQHDFLALSWNSNTGGLAGPLITMLQESARYLMIATGMTLVISTAGIDLSVGSVMAVAGPVQWHERVALHPHRLGCWSGHWLRQRRSGFLPGPTAVHHHPDYDARRPWYGQGHHLR